MQTIYCRLQEWAQSIHEDMDPEMETVLLCHHGVRSMRVAGFLASQVTLQISSDFFAITAHHTSIDASHACRLNIACCHIKVRLSALQGFQNLRNVTGGIDAYAREVDSSVPLY